MKKYLSFLALSSLLISTPVLAQDESVTGGLSDLDSNQMALLIIMGVIIGVIILLLILMIYLMSFISAIFRKDNPELAEVPSWWESFKQRFVTGDIKKEQAKDKLMTDHSYDGIHELDNFMPPWLQYVFTGTIIIALVYFGYYTVLGLGKTGVEEYQEEIRVAANEAEARGASELTSIDETNVEFDESDAALSAGKTIFEGNCAACHAADGGGGVGPNLTDPYWIHGGDIKDIFKVIKYGVIEKGMVPWEDQLNPQEIQEVASYILSLQGTSPAVPKDPQGESVTGDGNASTSGESEDSDDSTTVKADTTAVAE
ncbi:cbb3-type cytochrome c oxidase N-terminal domain-containing protein [Algoriphagus sp. C2-6-M1]|uniref:cbb3-type cytochrome c oxidase N-terminal domain-containing protein n=1 Tax=Algoriphagus persicinus TaxID=3108754 RepID=UPI002B3BDE4B|nr:cbb3-type cytochrome c oxidase N-terminal domain-containing protein [Algoriphagus sp. C2-6-M1]MEB2781931.1 cbb3-type cytochrome c oxidase N-terminal domain-containing protein [Algoriphagus sp. C2-6-M1]